MELPADDTPTHVRSLAEARQRAVKNPTANDIRAALETALAPGNQKIFAPQTDPQKDLSGDLSRAAFKYAVAAAQGVNPVDQKGNAPADEYRLARDELAYRFVAVDQKLDPDSHAEFPQEAIAAARRAIDSTLTTLLPPQTQQALAR